MPSSKAQKRPIVGRRHRPAKEPLSREAIAQTALTKLAEDGPSGLTLRKVAAALDTGPASLYVYIADVHELRDLTLDHALGNVSTPTGPVPEWRASLKAILLSYLRTLYETPGLGQLAMAAIPTGENALRITEALLVTLLQSGMPGAKAAWAVDLLTLYCASIAAEQDLRRTRQAPLSPVIRALDGAEPDRYPNIAALKAELTSGEGRTRFQWAFDAIVDGILAAPTPPTENEGSDK